MSRLIKLPLLHHNINIYNINGVIYATNPLKNNNKLLKHQNIKLAAVGNDNTISNEIDLQLCEQELPNIIQEIQSDKQFIYELKYTFYPSTYGNGRIGYKGEYNGEKYIVEAYTYKFIDNISANESLDILKTFKEYDYDRSSNNKHINNNKEENNSDLGKASVIAFIISHKISDLSLVSIHGYLVGSEMADDGINTMALYNRLEQCDNSRYTNIQWIE